VLQRDIGIRYNPDLVEQEDFFADSRNLFIHGVLETGQGTCSSLPPLYVAIGRRLGYPLKLVTTACHVFARWDEPGGERFNIECTSLGLNCHPDEYYLTWPVPVERAQIAPCCLLKSQSSREELAGFLVTRAHCLLDNGHQPEAAACYAHACTLAPANQLHLRALEAALDAWQERLTRQIALPWPELPGCPNLRRLPALAWRTEGRLLWLEAIESLFHAHYFEYSPEPGAHSTLAKTLVDPHLHQSPQPT
jgi:hypothetical protein